MKGEGEIIRGNFRFVQRDMPKGSSGVRNNLVKSECLGKIGTAFHSDTRLSTSCLQYMYTRAHGETGLNILKGRKRMEG